MARGGHLRRTGVRSRRWDERAHAIIHRITRTMAVTGGVPRLRGVLPRARQPLNVGSASAEQLSQPFSDNLRLVLFEAEGTEADDPIADLAGVGVDAWGTVLELLHQ